MEERESTFPSEWEIPWTNEQVARLWDYYSRTPPYADMYFSKVFGAQILKACSLPLSAELDVLDFGCGPGFLWDHLRMLGARWAYTGVDFSSNSVRDLQHKAAGVSGFVRATHITSLPMGFGKHTFDVVLLVEVVEHLVDAHLNATLQEASRLLKRGGTMVITTPNREDLGRAKKICPNCSAVFHEWQHVRSWSKEALTDYVRAYGFATRSAKELDFAVSGIMGRLVRLGRRLAHGPRRAPHLLMTFSKQ